MSAAIQSKKWLAPVAVIAAVACAESGGPTAAPAAPADLIGVEGQLVRCTPLPADSVTVTVGPTGGTIHVGPHALTIPAGALPAPVAITAVAPSASVNRVRLTPHGLTFLQDASLSMSYANCGLLGGLLPSRIAYVTEDLDILGFLLSTVDPLQQRVTGRLEHFSSYAVAW
jgi:hypothetical protein